ncbi:MAG: Response regulator rcp1 [Promethearchaeota archaeon]|nr:MAG: Response regulator rcp1 [Candidatus Lokiarchaeota archaeon]
MDKNLENITCVEILLVEDNEADIDLTREALKEFKILNNLHVVKNGEDALQFIYQQGDYSEKPTPDLVLLDLNLPKKNGLEVLEDIKNHKDLRSIPVVILTTSSAEEDIVKSYKLQASCYIQKPIDLNEFLKVVKTFGNFWFSIVKYPPNKQSDRGNY